MKHNLNMKKTNGTRNINILDSPLYKCLFKLAKEVTASGLKLTTT